MIGDSRNSIRSLAGIALAAALPILVFAVVASVAFVDARRDDIEQRYAATGRALLAAVDTSLLGQQAAVAGLADAIAADFDDLDRVRAIVDIVVAGRHGAFLAAVLSKPDGTDSVTVFETVAGLAAALADADAIRAAAGTGRSRVGSIVPVGPGGAPSFLPTRALVIDAEGRIVRILSVAFSPVRLAEIVDRQEAPTDLLITIFDRDLRIVARSETPSIIGRDAPATIRDQVESGRGGLFLNITFSGDRYLRVIETSPITGWRVAVGAREAVVYREMLGTLQPVAIAGLAAILVAALSASALARRFAKRQVASERRGAAQLKASEQRYRAISEASGQIHWSTLPDGSIPDEDSPSWRAYTGQTADEFLRPGSWMVALHPDDRERVMTEWQDAVSTGQPFETEYRLRHKSGTYRWMLARAMPLIGEDGSIASWIGMTIDIDVRKRAEQRQVLLMREVDHRAKNVLTVVLAVVQLTRAESIEAFATAITGRIAALARAHTLLAESRWTGGRLRELIESELVPFRTEAAPVRIDGPDITVIAEVVQPLAMMMHELATNAAKHGSLSKAGGSVAVSWSVDRPTGRLNLVWTETGGPPVTAPARTGFGSRLLKEIAARQLDGDVGLDWHPDGLRCTLVLPPRCLLRIDEGDRARSARPPATTPRWSTGAPPRILVVEDEGLIAMSLQTNLAEHGYVVIGPAATAVEAMALARSQPIDAALLDVNVGGTSILPFAEDLLLAGTAVVFYTGYGKADDITARFAAARVVTKPAGEAEITAAIGAALAGRSPAPV